MSRGYTVVERSTKGETESLAYGTELACGTCIHVAINYSSVQLHTPVQWGLTCAFIIPGEKIQLFGALFQYQVDKWRAKPNISSNIRRKQMTRIAVFPSVFKRILSYACMNPLTLRQSETLRCKFPNQPVVQFLLKDRTWPCRFESAPGNTGFKHYLLTLFLVKKINKKLSHDEHFSLLIRAREISLLK